MIVAPYLFTTPTIGFLFQRKSDLAWNRENRADPVKRGSTSRMKL
jgi:hypothetical protein